MRLKLIISYVGLAGLLLAFVGVAFQVDPPRFAAIVAGALGAAVALGFAMGRVMARPIHRMTATSARLAAEVEARIAELTIERDRLTALLEEMVEGVLVLDPAERVVLANPAAAKILGASDPLVGRTLAETIRHPAVRAMLEGAIREGKGAELELEPLDPSQRALLVHARPLTTASGRGAVAVLLDVTRLRRLETVRRDFVTNVSHELRTPIASILGYAESLVDGGVDDPEHARKFVEVIHRNASRLGRLVDDLLQLARLEARSAEVRARAPVPVAEVVERAVETLRKRASNKGITVTADVAEDLVVLGDADGVEQMLINLIDNAINYGKQGGRVAVRAARKDRSIEISVEDDGRGIETRHLPRIFERFYRVDEARSREEGGTGLGLAIVAHLAQSMGGSVRAASEAGRGSTFTISLPS